MTKDARFYVMPAVTDARMDRPWRFRAGQLSGSGGDSQRTPMARVIVCYRNRIGRSILYGLLLLLCTTLAGCQTLTALGGNPASTLADTYWKLIQIDGHKIRSRSDTRELYLLLTRRQQRVEGFSGCNNIDGQYRRQKHQLHFDIMPSGSMYCAQMTALEQAYLNALRQTTHARIHHRQLTLLDADNHPVAQFRARLMQ